jgi:hypothetical protein
MMAAQRDIPSRQWHAERTNLMSERAARLRGKTVDISADFVDYRLAVRSGLGRPGHDGECRIF